MPVALAAILRCTGAQSEMTITPEEQRLQEVFSLTRMIYSVCGAVIIYIVLVYTGWYLAAAQKLPEALNRLETSLYSSDVFFILVMPTVILAYRPKSELFRWSFVKSTSPIAPATTGVFPSLVLGLGYGLAAFALASPIFWLGDRHIGAIQMLMARALSPLPVLVLIVLIVGLAVTGEIVSRGIVLRTLVNYASTPAAILGSGALFAAIYPVFSFPVALILGIASGILYFRTRNLLAPIIANAVFTASGGALALYHSWMHRMPADIWF